MEHTLPAVDEAQVTEVLRRLGYTPPEGDTASLAPEDRLAHHLGAVVAVAQTHLRQVATNMEAVMRGYHDAHHRVTGEPCSCAQP